MPKLPFCIFRDVSPSGALALLLDELLVRRKVDLASAEGRRHALEALEAARRRLLEAGLLRLPVVAFDESLGDAERAQLGAIVKQLGGVCVVARLAEATHVVVPTPAAAAAAEPRADLFRVVHQTATRALVHWLYLPDAHDTWLARSVVQGGQVAAAAEHVVWTVHSRWLHDSAQFNGWMNEQDYEAQPAKRPGKRAREESDDERASKHARTGEEATSSVAPVRVVGRVVANANGDQSIGPHLLLTTAELEAMGAQHEAHGADAAGGTPATAPVVAIPTEARWFSLDAVHDIERRALPEFFSGETASKSEALYVRYRNFMIAAWRRAPSSYLTLTACRRFLIGDAAALMRIHAFLDSWGLINYLVPVAARPVSYSAVPAGELRVSELQQQAPDRGTPLVADSANGLQALNVAGSASLAATIDAIRSAAGATLGAAARAHMPLSSLAQHLQTRHAPARLSYRCVLCSATLDPANTYERHETGNTDASTPGLVLYCEACACKPYQTPVSFRRVAELGVSVAASRWSADETVRLLQALNTPTISTWNEVARAVGTRSKVECVTHFLQLPLDDPYYYHGVTDPSAAFGDGTPFARTANPALAVAGFLASSVDPALASVAARSALDELARARAPPRDEAAAPPALASDETRAFLQACGLSGAEVDALSVRVAAAAGLAAAGVKAQLLAEREVTIMTGLLQQLVEAQTRKVDAKLGALDAVAAEYERARQMLQAERDQLAVARARLP